MNDTVSFCQDIVQCLFILERWKGILSATRLRLPKVPRLNVELLITLFVRRLNSQIPRCEYWLVYKPKVFAGFTPA